MHLESLETILSSALSSDRSVMLGATVDPANSHCVWQLLDHEAQREGSVHGALKQDEQNQKAAKGIAHKGISPKLETRK
eukprot:166165-Amphidinium_carterae.1